MRARGSSLIEVTHRKELPMLALAALALAAACPQEKDHVPYLTPEQAVAKMTYPTAYEVAIFAAEPMIGLPIAFTFDPKVRVWVVENFNYRTRGNHTTDMAIIVSILEAADGD